MAELEDVLGIRSAPVNWPIGDGDDFRGVYDRLSGQVHLFTRTEHGARPAPVQATDLSDPALESLLGPDACARLRDDIELLDVAGEPLDEARIARGEITPLFFGSAVTNFGVELFLNRFLTMAPGPAPRPANVAKQNEPRLVCPEEPEFRGFIFKVQANMDPNHRDRIAFLRVVSGRFERDMTVQNARLNKPVRLTRPQKLFAQERVVMDEAFPGDIIGLTNPGVFAIGDTVAAGNADLRFGGIPRFLPEHFAVLRNVRTEKYKQFQKGIEQLSEEGVVQLFHEINAARTEPILGVVGRLQFEVVQFRLESEYGVETRLEPTPYSHVRWVAADDPADLARVHWAGNVRRVEDADGHLCALFDSEWNLNYLRDQNPKVRFLEAPPA
jgi:peptide chain release factor 3